MFGEKTYVKMYRYRIHPDKADPCLELQERAHRHFGEHVHYHVVHLRSAANPCEWLEIHWYPDEATYREGMKTLEALPETRALWDEFQTFLDPPHQEIEPEYFQRFRP
jgi:hypothetical protein